MFAVRQAVVGAAEALYLPRVALQVVFIVASRQVRTYRLFAGSAW